MAATKVERGFPPVVDAGIEVLILGSFPSARSLQRAQYYGHPQNQFWRLVGDVIGQPALFEMSYDEKKRMLLRHRMGLWDVISACRRQGSLDSGIREQQDNEFSRLVSLAGKLRRVCFNGRKAAEKEAMFAAWGYETVVLPSSSPAYTLRYERKLEQWRALIRPLRPRGSSRAAARPAAHPLSGPC